MKDQGPADLLSVHLPTKKKEARELNFLEETPNNPKVSPNTVTFPLFNKPDSGLNTQLVQARPSSLISVWVCQFWGGQYGHLYSSFANISGVFLKASAPSGV